MQCQVINYHKEILIKNQEISVFSMIFDTNWIITTIKSFICTTGYMQYMISGKHFYLYLIIILFGMIMMLIALKRKYQSNLNLKIIL